MQYPLPESIGNPDLLAGREKELASSAPHRYAAVYDLRFLVIIDEFQNTGEYIYRDKACLTAPDKSIPGTWHDLSESKIAPMLVTGSYVGWLINIIDTYRFSDIKFQCVIGRRYTNSIISSLRPSEI